jgi:hypothetical protein
VIEGSRHNESAMRGKEFVAVVKKRIVVPQSRPREMKECCDESPDIGACKKEASKSVKGCCCLSASERRG